MESNQEINNLILIKEEPLYFDTHNEIETEGPLTSDDCSSIEENQIKLETNSQVDGEDSNGYINYTGFPVIHKNNVGEPSSDLDDKETVTVSTEAKCPNTRRKLFVCYYCEFTSDWRKLFVNHVLNHLHTYTCELCTYKTTKFGSLKRHMRTHNGEKPYSCTVCSHKFNQSCHLKRHMRTHGEIEYSCTVCDYKCNQSADLKLHMRTHNGENQNNCTVCTYNATNLSSLKRHMRIHSGEKPYSCTVCDYKCNQSCHLKLHMRTHGEIQYSCTVCTYNTTDTNSLKRHMRTHTGEKPFSCTLCVYKCNVLAHLTRHMRTHIR